jgi:hypothetical protein
LIVRDELKQDVTTPYTRDLDIDQIDSDGRRVYIQIALEAGAYGISADDYYL